MFNIKLVILLGVLLYFFGNIIVRFFKNLLNRIGIRSPEPFYGELMNYPEYGNHTDIAERDVSSQFEGDYSKDGYPRSEKKTAILNGIGSLATGTAVKMGKGLYVIANLPETAPVYYGISGGVGECACYCNGLVDCVCSDKKKQNCSNYVVLLDSRAIGTMSRFRDGTMRLYHKSSDGEIRNASKVEIAFGSKQNPRTSIVLRGNF